MQKENIRPTIAYWKRAFKAHGATCVYCLEERKVKFTTSLNDYVSSSIDHLIPTAHGGSNEADNIVPACIVCNFYKKDLIVPEPDFSRMTEERSDGKTYVKRNLISDYIELMAPMVRTQIEQKRPEYEAFKRYIEGC